MKSKLEGAFSVVLAFALIFFIQYRYYSVQPWYDHRGPRPNTNPVGAVPVFTEYKVNVCATHDLGTPAKKTKPAVVEERAEEMFLYAE